MELFLKTPATQEPVTLLEVRSFLKLSPEESDETLHTLMAGARAHVERYTERALLKQEWQMNLKPPYPRCSPLVRMLENNVEIKLPKPPLLKVSSVRIKAEEVPFQIEGGKVILSPYFWNKEISVTYWTGYGETADALPPDLKLAVLMVIRCLYDGQTVDMALLKPFRVLQLV